MAEPTSFLALGGIAALVAAGWSQVKTAFAYVRGMVVVTATLEGYWLAKPTLRYLRRHYMIVPNGDLQYRYAFNQLGVDGGPSRAVPFKVLSKTVIFYRGLSFLMVSLKQEGITISAVRGTLNFNNLIIAALGEEEVRYDERMTSSKTSRYVVQKVVGSEKGQWAAMGGANQPIGSNSVTQNESSSGSTYQSPDMNIDRSFMYDHKLYTGGTGVDPLENLYFPPEIMGYLEQAKLWLSQGQWYKERGIPWRRGWMLYGPGGTGKSSLAKATAQMMSIPIYQYFMSTLSDKEFMEKWENMDMPCVVLLEDFDNVFHGRENMTEHKSLSFDTVLNTISGVASENGIFLIVTTNHVEHIDPAMGVSAGPGGLSTRPGRIDTIIHVSFMDRESRLKMASKVLRDWPEEILPLVDRDLDRTPAQFLDECVTLAFTRMTPVIDKVDN